MSQVRAKSIKRKIKSVKARRDVKRRRAKKHEFNIKTSMQKVVRSISKARFEALSYARAPLIKSYSDEIEWYSNKENSILGIILIDRTDSDYVVVVMGRDEVGVFRYIDGTHGIIDILEARAFLISKIEDYSKKDINEFPQGVTKRKKNLIFNPLVLDDVMPEDYKLLVNSDLFSPAREIIQEIAYSFEDPDGNYIEQFQSTGFNARLWELYLYALFHELDFDINRKFNAPDYVIEKSNVRVCIEAVTVNPSQNGFDEADPKTDEEIHNLLSDYMPIKYGSPLFSKLKKKYWEKEHVADHPLVLAIHDFHQRDSMIWSRQGLETYLYGAERQFEFDKHGRIKEKVKTHQTHTWKNKVIPSGFFSQPESENISAVIHSHQATVGKFLRMGYLAQFGRRDIDIMLTGQAYYNNSPIPTDYTIDIKEQGYEELWHDSITIYHNPNTRKPLDFHLFEGVAQVIFKDGKYHSIVPEFYPINARTMYRATEI